MPPQQTDQLDLRRFARVMRERWWLLVLMPVLIGGLAYGYSSTRAKVYTATAIMITGAGQGLGDINSISQVNQATQSLGKMITDRVVVQQGAETVDKRADIDKLLKNVSATVPADTQEIVLTVKDHDPKRAAAIANAITVEFSKLVAQRAGTTSNLSATVWQPAVAPKHPSSPRVKLVTLVGLVLGFLVGLTIALLLDYFDTRWSSEDDIESVLGVPLLGTIPDFSASRSHRRGYA